MRQSGQFSHGDLNPIYDQELNREGSIQPPISADIINSQIHNQQMLRQSMVMESHQPPAEFIYKHDFDKRGALFFLGTLGYRTKWENPDTMRK